MANEVAMEKLLIASVHMMCIIITHNST